MTKALILGATALALSTGAASAQTPGYGYAADPTPMQCQLIRWAVAQYGFAAARQHALETYGPEAVKTGVSPNRQGEALTHIRRQRRIGAADRSSKRPVWRLGL
jgi:hypothetical protein